MAPVLTTKVEFHLGGVWVTIPDVRQSPPIKVVAGAKDEDTQASPTKCTFTLNDSDGDYDPGNPMGQWFGQLTENTQVRVSIPMVADNFSGSFIGNGWGTADDGSPWVNGTSSGGTVSSTDWSVSGDQARHSVPAANAYRTSDLPTRTFIDSEIRLLLSVPVTDVTGAAVATLVKIRAVDDNNYIYVKLIINTNESIQLGVVDKISGVDRVLVGDTTISGLDAATHTSLWFAVQTEGAVVRAKVWSSTSIEGEPDWQVVSARATVREGYHGVISVIGDGNTNTKPMLFRYSEVIVGIPVFCGEIAEFGPGVADEAHHGPTVEITAAGIGRRVEQGAEPLKSAMFRAWSSTQRWVREGAAQSTADVGDVNTLTCTDADADDVAIGNQFRLVDSSGQHKEDTIFTVTGKSSAFGFTNIDFVPDALEPVVLADALHSWRNATATEMPVAYWPCEDERDATSVASGLPTGTAMEIRGGPPEFATLDSYLGSAPLLKLNDAELYGLVPNYEDTDECFTFHMLVHYPDEAEAAEGQAIAQLYTNSAVAEVWALSYSNAGADLTFDVRAFDINGAGELFIHSYGIPTLRGKPTMLLFKVAQVTSTTVEYRLEMVRYLQDGSTIAQLVGATTATGVTSLGKLTAVQINPGNGYVNVGVGHIGVIPADLRYFNLMDIPAGHAQENLPRRYARLSYEEGEPVTYWQGVTAAGRLGAQRRDTLLRNWQDPADVDLGRFYEAKGAYSFQYRTRSSLYNQEPVLDLDYEGGAVLAGITPVRDDQASRNDVTVKREGGSSARAVRETGLKSVEAIGRYTDAPTVNTAYDTDLPYLAAWRLHLGTVAEDRYPTVKVRPAPGVLSLEHMLSVGIGDRIRVTNANALRRFEPIDQLAFGYTLTLHRYVPTLELNCVPASPYNVAVLDEPDIRLDSETATLNEDLTTTETDVSVWTTGGTYWVTTATHAAEFPFDILIGGERCTVTAITGATNPQAMTVVRGVNGVVRTHTTGTPVRLASPYYLPL